MVVKDEPRISKYQLIASICRDSFWEFVKEFWHEIIDEPLIENWHMEYLCKELEKVAHRVFKRKHKEYDLLINISPGSSKSTIVSVMFPVWCWLHKPWVQTICGSYAQELSLDLSVKSRSIVWSEKFKRCFPEIVLRRDQCTKTWFQNERFGWRYATSTGGAVTGKHSHFIIIDDPVDPKGAVSDAEMKSAVDWLTNTIPTRKILHKITVIIMIMQRLAQNDPSGLWLGWRKKGLPIRHICIPAEISTDKNTADTVRPRSLRHYYKDGLMDPNRLGWEALNAQKLIGEYSYAGQYLQTPVPPGGGMFKTMKIETVSMTYTEKSMVMCRYWDKAGTHEAGTYTVGLLMGRDKDGVFWILDVVRGQWDAGEREDVIKRTASIDGRAITIRVEEEPGSGGKESAEATIRNLAGFRVKADRPTGDKVWRADPFAAQVNHGNFKMKRADWNDELIKELQNFPRSTYKDQVDAGSGAFAYLAKPRIKIGAL